ncbi:MAG: glucose 1-dehydrogenase [Deltaproteobacteria bacterium]|jgi:NAD(P)-dependent dehydrogenase (short-subunit alcohol dehydrogenase family)|nr:glucose 1-dehydrogenase [Deltaproteobacteria bacterium]
MKRLDQKVAIITGAAGGIGAAAARRFVAEGARVMLVDRDGDGLAALSHELGPAASDFIMADVSDESATASFVAFAVQRFGGLDIYFSNAGMEGKIAPLTEVSVADLDRIFAVNVRSVVLGLKHAVPLMIARGGGSFIATSSVAGLIGSPGLGPYVATKHAVLGLVKTAALELGPRGIRVNAISPGPIDNRMMRSIENQAAPDNAEAVKDGFTKLVALGRYGSNEEIAAAAAFLASSDSSYCSGTTIVCDGGFVAT